MTPSPFKIRPSLPHRGFALIVTLSLMVLLTLLAVGLLSLSAIAMRTSSHGLAMAEARANARVALLFGLAQLQREMGPDRRISAPSGILDGTPDTAAFEDIKHPRLTGVWDAADSPFTKWTLDQPSYDKEDGFRIWLVSGDPAKTRELSLPKNQLPGSDLAVIAPATADPVTKQPVIVPVLGGERSGFAWWTSDNGTKATLRGGEKPETNDRGQVLLAARRRDGDGHHAADPRLPTRDMGLDQRLVDLATVDAAMDETKVALKHLHDLTTLSETLPVDVTTGGFRKCMNLYLDWLETQSDRVRERAGTVGNKRGNSAATDYRLFSWDQLRNYESLGRASGMVTLGPGGRPQIRAHKQNGNRVEKDWNPTIGDDRFRVQPVLLKLGFVVSYSTERPTELNSTPKPYALRLHVYPLAVFWNPYNVDLVVPEYCIHSFCPLVFDFNKGRPEGVRVDLTQKQSAVMFAFGPEGGGARKTKDLLIPAGGTKVLYPQVVRWQTHPQEHRNSRFIWHYYIWGETGNFNLGDNNFGGVLKNLRGNQSMAYFNSQPNDEITGAANDTLTMQISHTTELVGNQYRYSFGMSGAHTDWWGNNGTGSDNAETLQKFGQTTFVGNRVETNSPQISLIPESEIPTRTFGQLLNKPTPLLFYECFRKAADEDLFPGKYGSFSVAGNPIHALTDSAMGNRDAVTPWFESPYTFRFKAVNSWFDVTKTFQLPPDSDESIYFGESYSPRGQLNVVDQEIPLTPLTSLGQFQHLPLFDYRPVYDKATATATTIWYGGDYGYHEGRVTQFPQNHAIGNSYASPGIPLDKLNQKGWRYQFNVEADHLCTDRSYIANAVLWDSWFCSSIAAQDGVMIRTQRDARKVAEEFLSGKAALPNDAMTVHTNQPADKLLETLFDGSGGPAKDAYTRVAEFLRVAGGFNVNSVSEVAWTQFLAGLFSRPMLVMESVTGSEAPKVVEPETGRFLISRTTLTNAPPAEQGTGKDREDRYWNGCREVSAGQLRELAGAIVRQVKKRGPFLSTAEFINRRLSRDAPLANSGALQTALDDADVSINAPLRGPAIPNSTSAGRPTYSNPAAAVGSRLQGITGWVTQADLLATLGPAISPRSDTFTIRALGQSRDVKGVVIATAWCEAVVQRDATYLDASEEAATATTSLKQEANKTFGRRFEIISFRWLSQAEVM